MSIKKKHILLSIILQLILVYVFINFVTLITEGETADIDFPVYLMELAFICAKPWFIALELFIFAAGGYFLERSIKTQNKKLFIFANISLALFLYLPLIFFFTEIIRFCGP